MRRAIRTNFPVELPIGDVGGAVVAGSTGPSGEGGVLQAVGARLTGEAVTEGGLAMRGVVGPGRAGQLESSACMHSRGEQLILIVPTCIIIVICKSDTVQ